MIDLPLNYNITFVAFKRGLSITSNNNNPRKG